MRKFFIFVILVLVVISFGKTKLTFWQFMMDDALAKEVLSGFSKEFPDIEVEVVQLSWSTGFDKIVTAIAAGAAPDVVELGNTWIANFASEGVLSELHPEDLEKYRDFPGMNSTEYMGKYYGYPWLLGTRAMFYNVDLMMKAGLDPDRPPQTWSELLEAARKISELPDVYGIGLPAGEVYSPWQEWFLLAIWGNGGNVISKDLKKATLNSQQNRDTARFYQELSKYALKSKQKDLGDAFGEGRVGFLVSGAWSIGTLAQSYPNLNYGVCLIPKPDKPDGIHASFLGGEILAVPSQTKNVDAARKFINYLMRPEIAMIITKHYPGVYPADPKASSDPWFEDNPLHLVFFEQLKTAFPVPPTPAWPKIEDVLTNVVDDLIISYKDVDEVLNFYNTEIQRILDEVGM
ncbi:MAG TPA: ABC transporter substrate-binding protein [Pseudothermotoga sp.]|nr:sugar ABC transporter substrate-binding protein [Pseudothermotoga lettingae]HBJ82020.1 ABC transporter substrate-binding protein [Pseudothermotoga sp.]HBT25364.1 ABC transporter substrate-binding protein [Pseudothermotoga sp.]